MQWEVYTIGGGAILVDIFQAVVAIIGTSAYEKMRGIVIVIAVAWVAIQRAFDGGQHTKTIKYGLTFGIIWGALVVPTGTVKVNDSLNPTLAPAVVANVPIGLGLFASATSSVGHELTRLMEASFTTPDNLSYQKNGMIFGAKMMEAATRLQITDSAFAQSVDAYARQCIFPALFLGHMDLNDLMQSTDIWGTVMARPSPARMFELRERNPETGRVTRSIVTCAAGAPRLTAKWNAELNRAADIFGRRWFPNETQALARARFLSALPSAHDHLIGASRAALDIMRQQMTINAVYSAAGRWVGETGNAAAMQSYIQARAEIQTRAAYQSIGIAAGKLVPTLKAVFEGLFYGFFPIAVLLMLTPVGLSVFKSYFFGFVWLQTWAPLSAILHRMMEGKARSHMTAMADMGGEQGISMVAQSGIQAIESDIAVSAGYLMASLPFISLWLLKGGVHYASSLATSYLAVGQQAASEAAREGTTGNISLGNTSQDIHRFATTEGFKSQQSPLYDAARVTSVQEDGSQLVHHADGRASSFQGTAGSDLPTSVDFAKVRSDELRQSASDSRALAQSQSASAASSQAAATSTGTSLLDQVSQNVASSEGFSRSLSADEREDFSAFNKHVDNLSQIDGLDKQSSLAIAAHVGAGGEFGWGLFKANITGNAEGKTISQDTFNATQQYLDENQVAETASRALSASQRLSAESSDSELRSLGETYSGHLTEARQFEDRATASLNEAQSFENQAAQVESQSAAMNQRLQGQFFEYVAGQTALNGQELGSSGAARLLNSRNLGDQEAVRHLANDFVKENFIRNEVPDSGSLAGEYAQQREILRNDADVAGVYADNLGNIRAGGENLSGPNQAVIKEGVKETFEQTGNRIDDGQRGIEDNQAAKQEIQKQANQTALAGSGSIGKTVQDGIDWVLPDDPQPSVSGSQSSQGQSQPVLSGGETIPQSQSSIYQQEQTDFTPGESQSVVLTPLSPERNVQTAIGRGESQLISSAGESGAQSQPSINQEEQRDFTPIETRPGDSASLSPESNIHNEIERGERQTVSTGGDTQTQQRLNEAEQTLRNQQERADRAELDRDTLRSQGNWEARDTSSEDQQKAEQALGKSNDRSARSGRSKT